MVAANERRSYFVTSSPVGWPIARMISVILSSLHHLCLTMYHSYLSGLKIATRIACDMKTSSNGNIFRVTCAGNSPVTGEFPAQRPVTRSFDVFFDLRPNKRLSKQSWGCRFETLACPLWRHCNGHTTYHVHYWLDLHPCKVILNEFQFYLNTFF